jgi:hypothetical protein
MPRRFEPVAGISSGHLRIYRNRRILPRAFIAIDSIVTDSPLVIPTVVENPDPRVVVLESGHLDSWRPRPHKWLPNSVQWTSPAPGLVSLQVKGTGERMLATSLTHPYGWSATSKGEDLRTLTINHAFLGVIVPPQVHEVELRFIPPGFRAGIAISAVGIIIVVALLAWPRLRRPRGPGVLGSWGLRVLGS